MVKSETERFLSHYCFQKTSLKKGKRIILAVTDPVSRSLHTGSFVVVDMWGC